MLHCPCTVPHWHVQCLRLLCSQFVDDGSEMEIASSTIIAILLSLVDIYASELFESIPWRPNTSSSADFDSVCTQRALDNYKLYSLTFHIRYWNLIWRHRSSFRLVSFSQWRWRCGALRAPNVTSIDACCLQCDANTICSVNRLSTMNRDCTSNYVTQSKDL